MSVLPKPRRLFLPLAVIVTFVFAMVALRAAATCHEGPFAGILVDPDGVVSTFGIPRWDGFQKGLTFPHRIVEVDGARLVRPSGRGFRASVWDAAVAAAAAEERPTVHVEAETARGRRSLDLAVTRFDALGFWLIGIAPIGIAALYATSAFIALVASPRGRLSRTFAKTTLFAALFLFCLFDYHTTRHLVPFFHLAFPMVSMGLLVLPLRLPDDVPLLERRPWIPLALDVFGLSLALAMLVSHLLGGTTVALRHVCSGLFAASSFFFGVTFLVRFLRARGDRRATMRALLLVMVPAHMVLGAGFLLGSFGSGGASFAFLVVPALGLTPIVTVVALIRHDLWGSRVLLSRVVMRMVIQGLACLLAAALGAAMAALLKRPLDSGLLAATVAGALAGLLVEPALRVGDRALFPSRAVYKPTIEQLSEELTLIAVPEEVGRAVEHTVRRFLPCESVEFRLLGGLPGERESGPRERVTREPSDPGAQDQLSLDVLFRGWPLAVLRVGKKRGGALYTSEDIDLLRTIANQAALALAHAYSYAELEERRRQQAQAWRGEREALVETVAAEIAHEVRYPINYFRGIFRRGQGEVRLDTEEIDIGCEEVERLERLVSGLRRVSSRRLERRVVSVSELVSKAERLLRDQLGPRSLEVRIPGATSIRCDLDQVTQVLVNVLSNALDAAGQHGRVGVAWTTEPDGGELVVWDTGPGFEGDPARVFAPWYTTKPRGTGLGLAITHRIVRAHGWTIDPERRDGTTRFVITVPRTDLVSYPPAEEAPTATEVM